MMSKPGKKLLGRFAAVDPEGFKRGLEAFQGLPLGGPDSPWWKLLEQLGIDPVNVEFLIAVIEQGKWKDSTAPCLYIWQAVHRRAGDRYRDSLSHITGVTGQRRPDADGRTICFADCAKGSMCSEDIKPRGGRRGRDGLFRDVTGERAERAW